MDLALYQKMIGSNKNITQAYINDTIHHVNDSFTKSPSFRVAKQGVDEVDCIINRRKSKKIEFLFRPSTKIEIGSYLTIEDDCYLVDDAVDNEIYPKAFGMLCNRTLKWKNSSGEVLKYMCSISGSNYEEDTTKTTAKSMYNSDGELTIKVQYNNNTKYIRPQMRFVLDDMVYEVKSINSISNTYNGSGVLVLTMKFTNTSQTDDKDNQIADNSGNSGWGEW